MEGARHAVDDEAGGVLGADGSFAERLRQRDRCLDNLLAAFAARHDFDQRHERGRVEEVHPHDPFGVVGRGGDLANAEGGGVAGKDRFVAQPRLQILEDPLLQLDAFGRGLHDELRGGRIVQIAANAQTGDALRGLVMAELALFGEPVDEIADAFVSRGQHITIHIVKQRLIAMLGRELGDARAHRARADHGDVVDVGVVHGALRMRLYSISATFADLLIFA